MSRSKELNKINVLACVIRALKNGDTKVVIDTLMPVAGSKNPRLPANANMVRYNFNSALNNSRNAKSIKIGTGIKIERMSNSCDGNMTKGWHYLVRTPRGEAKFAQTTQDVNLIWCAAMDRYDAQVWGDNMYGSLKVLYKYMHSDLRQALQSTPWREETRASKIDRAVAKMRTMGIEPTRLIQYMNAQKQK